MTPESDPSESFFLEHLTWPEVELAITRGTTTVVVPVGAIEQHGPHLPLSVDAELGAALGWRVARNLGDALVAPTIRVGCSEHHMAFAGTISLEIETLEAVCRDYCRSLARHGFTDICLLPSHGGNFAPLREMVPRLQEAVETIDEACWVGAYTDLLGLVGVWRLVVEEELGLGARVGGHADIAEASQMLHVRPELVRAARAEPGRVGELDATLAEQVFEKGLRAITANGILGDPRGMDAEVGERILEAVARVIAESFREDAEPDAVRSGRSEAKEDAT
jgi:creatinine amidohydrolase